MTHTRLFGFAQKSLSMLLISAAAVLLLFPVSTKAEEGKSIPVIAYAEQEGMGNITSYCNEVVFKDSTEAQPGDVIRVSAAYYPKCTFEGWYVNGTLKTLEKNYSFTVTADAPMYIVSAKFRQNGEHLKGHAELDISQTSWANRTCRFAEGSGAYNISVTTAMAVQGEQCIAAFETVLGDYKLARTYNITFTKYYNKNLETLDTPASLVFQIPQELQASGRIFRMINVYKGQPTVLEDADSSEATITFTSDKAGAYALVYKDVPSSMPPEGVEIDPQMAVTPEAAAVPEAEATPEIQ